MTDYPFTFGEEFSLYNVKYLKVYPGPFSVPSGFKTELSRVYDFKPREDDVWFMGAPKSGTTWLAEIIWTVCNDADTEKAKKLDYFQRFLFPEAGGYLFEYMIKEGRDKPEFFNADPIELANSATTKRFIKSHLPLEFLPPNLLDTCKCVYIARDPKDCCVSFYHFKKNNPYMEGVTMNSMAEDFLNDKVMMGPYPLAVKQYWEKRTHKNLLFLFYEELILDFRGSLRKVANFFGKTFTDNQIENLMDHLSLKSMKTNDCINMKFLKDIGAMNPQDDFIRKGIIGDYKNYFTPELETRFDEWWKKYFSDPTYRIPTQ